MIKHDTDIKGVYLIDSDCFGDNRGWFMETFNKQKFHELGIDCEFVQDNLSYSSQKGTFRGLHYQKAPYSQAKLVRCIQGSIIDVVVDIRKGSPTYLKWVSYELSEENKRMLFMPKGVAHGFLTITDEVLFQYKCDELYNKESEGGIIYNDPTINIDWDKLLQGVEPILSQKDKDAPRLEDCNANFIYEE